MTTALGSSNIRGYQSTMSVLVGYVDHMSSPELLMAFRLTLNLLERIGELMNKIQEQQHKNMPTFNTAKAFNSRLPNNINVQNNYRRSLMTNVGGSDGPVITSVASSSQRPMSAPNHRGSLGMRAGGLYSPRMPPYSSQRMAPRQQQNVSHNHSGGPGYRVLQTAGRTPTAAAQRPSSTPMMRPPVLQPSPGNIPNTPPVEPRRMSVNITEPIELSDDEDTPSVVATPTPSKHPRMDAAPGASTSTSSSSSSAVPPPPPPVITENKSTTTTTTTTATTSNSTPAPAINPPSTANPRDNTDQSDDTSNERERLDALISQTPGRSIIQKLNHLLDSSERVTNSGQTVYICPICKKDYTIRASIRYHLRVIHFKMHLKEKDVQCRRCGRRFTSVGAVNRHIIRCTFQHHLVTTGAYNWRSSRPPLNNSTEELEQHSQSKKSTTTVLKTEPPVLMPSLMKGSETSLAAGAAPHSESNNNNNNEGSSTSSSSVLTSSIELKSSSMESV